jgi:hypothetical protein
VVTSVLAAAACSGSGHAALHHPRKTYEVIPSSITSRVVLPSRTMMAGSSMTGHVIVWNNTGHNIRVASCGMPFAVALASRIYQPTVAFATCLDPFTIRTGRSSYQVTVFATYLACSLSRPSGGEKACLPGKRPPPLPIGHYRARLFQSANVVPAPPAPPVWVTPVR